MAAERVPYIENRTVHARQVERVAGRRLWWVGLLSFFTSSVASLVALNLLVWALTLPADFPPFQPVPVVGSVALGVLGGTLVYAVLGRLTRRPITVFRVVAVIALVLSLVPNVLFLGSAQAAPFPGISPASMATLGALHLVTAAITVALLTTLGRER